MLVDNNFTLFFDLESDGNHSRYLHSVVLFSEPSSSTEYVDNMMNGARPHAPAATPLRTPPPHAHHTAMTAHCRIPLPCAVVVCMSASGSASLCSLCA